MLFFRILLLWHSMTRYTRNLLYSRVIFLIFTFWIINQIGISTLVLVNRNMSTNNNKTFFYFSRLLQNITWIKTIQSWIYPIKQIQLTRHLRWALNTFDPLVNVIFRLTRNNILFIWFVFKRKRKWK